MQRYLHHLKQKTPAPWKALTFSTFALLSIVIRIAFLENQPVVKLVVMLVGNLSRSA